MARLSNFFRKHDDTDPPAQALLQCRPALRSEIDDGLRLLLAGNSGLAADEQVLDFLSVTIHRGVDINALWVATRPGVPRPEWALLPMVSPGKTMLMLTPSRLFRHTPVSSIQILTNEVCSHYAQRGIHLAQLLLDPRQPMVRDAYFAAGFEQMAELFYLSRTVRHAMEIPALPEGFELRNYSAGTEAMFASTISLSYRNSLDCPGLNGMRDVADVLEGHKAAGEFDPNLWFVLLEHGQPRAVLLLNRSAYSEAIELVYLGLVPEARGRGIGDLMMRLALAGVSRAGRTEISLAVDAINAPALKLYFRHGMQQVGDRLALLKDLRPHAAPQPLTIR